MHVNYEATLAQQQLNKLICVDDTIPEINQNHNAFRTLNDSLNKDLTQSIRSSSRSKRGN